jgi:hypothetical protein
MAEKVEKAETVLKMIWGMDIWRGVSKGVEEDRRLPALRVGHP